MFILCLYVSLSAQNEKPKVIPNQYIIFLQDDFHKATTKQKDFKSLISREARAKEFKTNSTELRQKLETELRKGGLKEFKLINVVSGNKNFASIKIGSKKDEALLRKYKFIRKIEKDYAFKGFIKKFEGIKLNKQELDWGISDVGAENSSGVGKYAFVVDTGIYGKHPDLNVNTTLSISFVPAEPAFKDNNGHGTHVAGIIGAKDNFIGVKGVAAGATIIGVKVLNAAGSGTWSQLIAGNTYVAAVARPGDVANYSLSGTSTGSITETTLQAQFNALGNAGIYVTLAAGNANANASGFVPARFNNTNVYTISAYDSNLNIASFSNFGNGPVDFAAPGVDIKSCDLKKNGYYSEKSGTSMAAPYVAGILLVNGGVINNNGPVATDKDGTLDLRASL